ALDRILVTAHVEPFPKLEHALDALRHLDARLSRTTFGLVISLLQIFYDADGNFFDELRGRADRMEAQLDSGLGGFRFEELIATERAVSRVVETWLDNATTIRRLSHIDLNVLNVTQNSSAVDMLAETVQVFRLGLEAFERRLDKVHRHYESMTHDVTERRLSFLTVISTISLPLGLLAGIYGMNFADMPGLHLEY